MPHTPQFRDQQRNVQILGSKSCYTDNTHNDAREHTLVYSQIHSGSSVLKHAIEVHDKSQHGSSSVRTGGDDLHPQPCTATSEKTATLAGGSRCDQAKRCHTPFIASPLFTGISFNFSDTRRDFPHEEIECLLDSASDQQVSQDQTCPSYIRATAVSTYFVLAAATAFYESSRPHDAYRPRIQVQDDDDDPSLMVTLGFVARIVPLLIFSGAVSMIYRYNAHQPCQDWFILSGIVLGAVGGLVNYRDLQDAMLKVVPWGILAALALSMAAHWGWEARVRKMTLCQPGYMA